MKILIDRNGSHRSSNSGGRGDKEITENFKKSNNGSSSEFSINIYHYNRVILAIGKHVGAAEAAVCGYIPIRIDKAPGHGVVVTGVQVVEAGFLVKVVAAVAQGVDVGNVAWVPRDVVALPVGDGENIAPGVVGIFCRQVAVFVRQPDDVPLQVLDQRIPHILVIQRADGICLCCVLELKI